MFTEIEQNKEVVSKYFTYESLLFTFEIWKHITCVIKNVWKDSEYN